MIHEGIQQDGMSADTDDESKSRMGMVHGAALSFQLAEVSLTTAPVLKLPDFERQFVVTTDASDAAVGAILEQDFGNVFQVAL